MLLAAGLGSGEERSKREEEEDRRRSVFTQTAAAAACLGSAVGGGAGGAASGRSNFLLTQKPGSDFSPTPVRRPEQAWNNKGPYGAHREGWPAGKT